jgi:hypothetical protein
MPDLQNTTHFIVLLAVSVLAAYLVTLALVGTGKGRTVRVLLSGFITAVFVHAYLIIIGEGLDQFVLVSVLFVMIYGAIGSFLLDWIRSRFLGGKG